LCQERLDGKIYNLYLQSGLIQAASAAVILLIVALATFLVLRTLASGRLLARVDGAHT
jgi:molybdate/tungstate transport system permease protein